MERSAASPPLLRVRDLLTLCSKSILVVGFQESESSVTELVSILDSMSKDAASNPDNKDLEDNIFKVLTELFAFLSSPQLDQTVIDTLSFELPKAVSKLADASSRCLEVVGSIIDHFVATCSPRDMLSILCEALDSPVKTIKISSYSAPLLYGLSKVFLSIQRRHYEQLKVAVPIIIKVLKEISSEPEVELEDLSERSLDIANSIREVCMKLKGKDNEKLRALLGLYVLQTMAVLSVSIKCKPASCFPQMKQLTHFFTYCGFSYLGLITGSDVDRITSIVAGDDEDDYMSSFSDVKLGASLSVIWRKISDGVTQDANADLTMVAGELQSDQAKRWLAYDMFKHLLSSADLFWDLRKHAIDFLLCVTNGVTSSQSNDKQMDCSPYMPSLYATLQAITLVIMYAPDTDLRKKAFDALKKVLADIPTAQRFEILSALVTNSKASSMTAILLDLVRANIQDRSLQAENGASAETCVLDLVESVLRPPEGGPPLLPEQGDAVLAALNLYRFALLTESRGKNKCKGVLSKKNLRKAYDEWFLPLRTLVSGIMAENKSEHDQCTADIVCSLNPIELVLYRCIELVEEKLKIST